MRNPSKNTLKKCRAMLSNQQSLMYANNKQWEELDQCLLLGPGGTEIHTHLKEENTIGMKLFRKKKKYTVYGMCWRGPFLWNFVETRAKSVLSAADEFMNPVVLPITMVTDPDGIHHICWYGRNGVLQSTSRNNVKPQKSPFIIRQGEPGTIDDYPKMIVFIYSREHGAYWGNHKGGLTGPEDAGLYTLELARAATSHCGPDKGIEYHLYET